MTYKEQKHPLDWYYDEPSTDDTIDVVDNVAPVLLGGLQQLLVVIFGPPGTGKTTKLLEKLEELLAKGIYASEIAFVSFTNAAVDEAIKRAMDRFKLRRRAFPWFRTIHSTAWKLMTSHFDVMGPKHWTAFTKEHGYSLSSGSKRSLKDIPTKTDDDKLLYVHEWGRANMLSLEKAQPVCRVKVPLGRLRRFSEHLDDFKLEHGLVDFSEMLELCLNLERDHSDVSVAIIDEAQDLSPLQIALVERWFGHCSEVYIAGDDDQCIFTWAGADPSWLIGLENRASRVIKLDKSHRVPGSVHSGAQRIIRCNRNRVKKIYKPQDSMKGRVLHIDRDPTVQHLERLKEKVFILARDSCYLNWWMKELRLRAIPFLVNGGVGAKFMSAYQAVETGESILRGNAVEPDRLANLVSWIPSRDSSLLPYGTKKAVEIRGEVFDDDGTVTLLGMAAFTELGLNSFLEALKKVGPVAILPKLLADQRRYLNKLRKKHNGQLPEPSIALSTIHRVKGDEAHTVVIDPRMTTASWDEYTDGGKDGREAEHRVAYVAVTRAKQDLILVSTNRRKHFPYEDFF
jgi:ATP-dependent DNA helicase UvrD/PcrA